MREDKNYAKTDQSILLLFNFTSFLYFLLNILIVFCNFKVFLKTLIQIQGVPFAVKFQISKFLVSTISSVWYGLKSVIKKLLTLVGGVFSDRVFFFEKNVGLLSEIWTIIQSVVSKRKVLRHFWTLKLTTILKKFEFTKSNYLTYWEKVKVT